MHDEGTDNSEVSDCTLLKFSKSELSFFVQAKMHMNRLEYECVSLNRNEE